MAFEADCSLSTVLDEPRVATEARSPVPGKCRGAACMPPLQGHGKSWVGAAYMPPPRGHDITREGAGTSRLPRGPVEKYSVFSSVSSLCLCGSSVCGLVTAYRTARSRMGGKSEIRNPKSEIDWASSFPLSPPHPRLPAGQGSARSSARTSAHCGSMRAAAAWPGTGS